jgi:hypothetical protein
MAAARLMKHRRFLSSQAQARAKPTRWPTASRIAGFAVYFLANDFLRDLGEISLQGGIQLLEFRPQRLLDEALGSFNHDGLTVHPRMAEWSQACGATIKVRIQRQSG